MAQSKAKKKSNQKVTRAQREERERAQREREERAQAKKARSDKLKKAGIVVVCVILIVALGLPTMALAGLFG